MNTLLKHWSLIKLFMVIALAAVAMGLANPLPTDAASSYQIRKGETKSYWSVATVYYYPQSGDAPSKLDAWISSWAYWLNDQPPKVTVDLYVSSGSPGREGWNWMYRIDAKPWRKSSPPLWLNSGVYKFEIRSSEPAWVNLRLR